MKVRSALKSPGFLSASGLAGGGATGVGGWQIYEAVDPTVDRNLTGMGFIYSPISTPVEAPPTEAKFTQWNNWECVGRLFPGVQIDHSLQSGTSSPAPSAAESPENNLPAENNFIACAMMRLEPVTLDKFTNQLYFKSEVVVKGENYGWMMWTGLSTLPEKDNNSYKGAINFLHKLLFLKKESGSGNIKHGYAWFDYSSNQNQSDAKFVIATATEDGFGGKKDLGKVEDAAKEIPTRKGTGIGISEAKDNPGDKTLIKSISVYEQSAGPEFWGSDGSFPNSKNDKSSIGYDTAILKYDVANKKGITLAGQPALNLSSYLKNVYDPFKEKKVVGNDLESWCNDGSRRRNRNVSANYKNDLQLLCYKNKPN